MHPILCHLSMDIYAKVTGLGLVIGYGKREKELCKEGGEDVAWLVWRHAWLVAETFPPMTRHSRERWMGRNALLLSECIGNPCGKAPPFAIQ